jgi:hypothetical protein
MAILPISICDSFAEATMSANPERTGLRWEGRDNRVPDRFLVLRVQRVEKEGGGLFGLRRSPSLAENLPDATILEGEEIGPSGNGARVTLHLPGADLPPVNRGDRVVLGVVGENACICVLAPPSHLADDQVAGWASSQPCGRT